MNTAGEVVCPQRQYNFSQFATVVSITDQFGSTLSVMILATDR